MDGLDLKSNTHLLQGSLLLLADPLDLEAPGLPAGQRGTERVLHTLRHHPIEFTDVNLAEH